MAQLIERFYEPVTGEIYMDDKANNKIKLRVMRHQISYLATDALILNLSVAKNVSIAKPDATKEEITEALRMADAMEFVEQYQNGIDQDIDNEQLTDS